MSGVRVLIRSALGLPTGGGLGLVLAMVLTHPAVSAELSQVPYSNNEANLCSQFDFATVTDIHSGKIRHLVSVVEKDAEVRAQADATVAVTERLAFSRPLFVIGQTGRGAWVQVAALAQGSAPLGWMAGRDLLCRQRPLRDPVTGLDRKAVIKTEGAVGTVQPVIAHRSSSEQACGAGDCPTLQRFDIQYVFAERNGRALLSKDFVLDVRTTALTGWVDATDKIIRWNTAFGLRPSELLDGTKPVCAYRTVDDARVNRDCRPMIGGHSWFLSSTRLPILEEQGEYYKVAVNATGVDNVVLLDANRIAISGAGRTQNQIDVFFVVDGTESMSGMIETLKGASGRPGIVEQITSRLKEKAAQGVSFRFGFRIYRDAISPSYNDLLGEAFPLSNKDCIGTETQHGEFYTAFSRVTAHGIRNPNHVLEDYAENLYGGIYQGLIDMAGCPDNTKLMFVIGDAGYDPVKQKQRGFQPIELGQLVAAIRNLVGSAGGGSGSKKAGPIPGIFVIEMPPDPSVPQDGPRQKHDYNRAYESFASETREMLSRLYTTEMQSDPSFAQKQFTALPAGPLDEGTLNRISDRVAAFSRPDLVNRVEIDLRGGQSLVEAIRDLQRGNRDVPILFWSMLQQRLCPQLDEQCHTQRVEGVNSLYVKKSDDVVTELRLTSEQMEIWRIMLSDLRNSNLGGLQLRRALGTALTRSVERAVNIPYADTREEMQQFVRRVGGLPVREHSPLMSYALDELLDEHRVTDCEIDHVQRWLNTSSRVLDVLQRGTFEPIIQFTEPDARGCALTEKGRHVPATLGDLSPRPLGSDDTYSYAKAVDNAIFYWIPQRFMP